MLNRINARVAAFAAVAAMTVGGGAFALASDSPSPDLALGPGTIHGCVFVHNQRTLEHVFTNYKRGRRCPAGSFMVVWNAKGPAGKDAILTVSASTSITNWPEGSGWAIDNFTRTVTITRQHAAPSTDCGATATQCWFYTETLADNGSFTTVDGHASPNGSSSDVITGAWTGTISGGGKLEFYASSDTPNPALVPGTADNKVCGTPVNGPCSTTNWYKMFFPGSTAFATAASFSPPWITYDWAYSVTVPCGSSTAVNESWNDGINPGDDGQGAGDGNITGSTACSG